MLIRLQSGFHFRRGVPVRFRTALGKREIWHSLETLDRNLARTRACALYGLTSQLFECISLAMSPSKETSSLTKAVETFQEALATSDLHPVQQDLFQSIVQTYDSEIQALKARYKTMNAEHLLARMQDHQRVSSVLEKIGPEINALTDIIHKLGKSARSPGEEALTKLSEQVAALTQLVQPPAPNPSPLFSEASETFLSLKAKKAKPSVMGEHRNTYRRFVEICGDRPIRDYTGEDAGLFKNMIEQLPVHYGKNRKDTRPVAELTAEANRKNLERISGKASKNHFTRLSALWRHYKPVGLIDRNPFIGGWKFDTTAKTHRIRWSNDDLITLIENPWPFQSISQATYGLIVGIASYTGMREEEICRLRPQDIVQIRDVWSIVVQIHRAHKDAPWEAWDPKTEAGARIIPLCRSLLDTGIVEMAKRAKNQRRRYLFKDLDFTGMDMKRSGIFQRNFSSFKSRLGIGREKVFHSFRHNVSTKLRNIHEYGDGGLRESWIDDFLGHEGQNRSVGNTIYFDDVDITNLKRVADSMSYPEFWDLKRLMGKQ
ncbi:phage integrase [Neoasaia chiangmaiensis NBRC 101099]|uniref:Integrase n=1 Tax=Neoasaia chiangmaiensis TaxID=320497 RepID=A0A1U9KNT5_9PROT|nr:DUF6538 domain-containing protein [Neoasaia chiangmaiensis]AQS87462.1 integrase [Neoasaia chiangmaiensis]GBR42629.1 phage integrase [Neoasaia chiangmaiensis NBRC 101099]GEN16246.1 integrase [Neoasaia chiangmaiensis]